MGRPRGTDGSLMPSLPWTLASLGIALAPHLPYLAVWITVALVGCGLWRYSIEKRRAAIPPAWFRAPMALAGFLGVLFTYGGISGVGPGTSLLAVMASLKLLETRQRRDQFVLLFIAIFLVMSSLLREQYIWSLPYLVVSLVFIMTAWLRMSAQPSESIRRSFATAGRLIGYAAPLAIVMWVFFPRLSTPLWAVPLDTSSGVSGISGTMSPGDISSLSLSTAPAFRVRFDGEIPQPRDQYWRGLVLHTFTGRQWSGNDPMQLTFGGRGWSGNHPDFKPVKDQVSVRGKPVRYRVTMEPTGQQYVFALDMPYEWDIEGVFMSSQQTLLRERPVDQRVAYAVESYADYDADANTMDFDLRKYVQLPPERRFPRTAELARRMRSEAASTDEFINAVLAKFHNEEFYYTLQPPALGNDPIDRFLFETRQGFCEHYASAFTVMMRAAGVPARVVLGYQGGEYNPNGDYLIVRQSDAHAWAEVWIPGSGWRRVDPTSAVAPERIELGVAGSIFDGIGMEWGLSASTLIFHNLQLYWDSLNAQWNDLVLGYGPDKQNAFMRLLGMAEPSWRKMMLTLITLVVALIVLISAALILRYRPPPRDQAALLYRKFVRRTGLIPAVGETPIAFANRVNGNAKLEPDLVHEVTGAYLNARYGSIDPAALQILRRRVAAIR